MTDTAQGAQFDFNVLFVIALPVLLGVWIYMIYAFVMWRASRGGPEPVGGRGGPRQPRDPGGLDRHHDGHRAVPGRIRHLRARPAGRRRRRRGIESRSGRRRRRPSCRFRSSASSGSSPTATRPSAASRPTSSWCPTTRRSSSTSPRSTSIHSFWAYQLGVKADANPGYNNVAYTTPQQLGSFTVRCAELCGIWHGAMYNNGVVVTPQQFLSLGEGHRGQAAPEHQAAPALCPHLHPRRQRCRRRLLPRQRRPVLQRRDRTAPRSRREAGDSEPPSCVISVSSQLPSRGNPAMAIDTTQVGEFEYPGEEDVGTPPRCRRRAAARTGSAPTSCGPWSGASSAT